MITVCEKCLLGTGQGELRLKNYVPTQLYEDSVRFSPLCLFLCRAKDGGGGGVLPGISAISGLFCCCCHHDFIIRSSENVNVGLPRLIGDQM